MKDFSYITHSSPAFIENLYRDFVSNPESVDPELRKFFEGFDFAISHGTPVPANGNLSKTPLPAEKVATADKGLPEGWKRELSAYRLILGYRNKGHLIAKTNPCLLYTSDAADERSSVDLGGRRIIKKKNKEQKKKNTRNKKK